MENDIQDMTSFFNEVEIIRNEYQFLDIFQLTDRINDLLQKYAKNNPIFTVLKCICYDNDIQLIINVNHIRADYVYEILKATYQSKHLLNIL